jgi:phenylpropionate dioxygenase-like ring-hydroxylating dioxygenase large terminal subunit
MRLALNHWYPVLEGAEVRRKPIGARRLGIDLVVWRDAERRVVVQEDRCPHLGASLRHGSLEHGCLVCPFHGLRFDSTGRCTHAPSLGADAEVPLALRVRTFATREQHGFVWLWWGDAAPDPSPVPFFDELLSGWTWRTTCVEWQANYSRAIENQLDVAHLAFVHRNTIGAGGRARVDGPHVEVDERSIRVWVTNRKDDSLPSRTAEELAAAARGREPALQFLFPGLWLLNIGPRFKNFIAFVPIDEGRTIYYLRSYLPNRFGIAGPIAHLFAGWSNRFILAQDRRVVVTQTPQSSLDARDDHLLGADRAIIEYRKWLARAVAKD